jgi:hypothetical protein
LTLRLEDCLKKCRPTKIDAIIYVVTFCILVAIDLVAALWSMSFKKSHKHWGALQHVGVIVKYRHYKESMLNLDIMTDCWLGDGAKK